MFVRMSAVSGIFDRRDFLLCCVLNALAVPILLCSQYTNNTLRLLERDPDQTAQSVQFVQYSCQ